MPSSVASKGDLSVIFPHYCQAGRGTSQGWVDNVLTQVERNKGVSPWLWGILYATHNFSRKSVSLDTLQ